MSSLYLHLPFCRRKCPYCDFFSLAEEPGALARYTDLLIRNIETVSVAGGWSGPFSTVFFGGGTPSLFSAGCIEAILETVQKRFGLDTYAEISMEANPGTLSLESLKGYRAAGVNRLSIGVQSLDARALGLLGRIHSPEDAVRAVDWARQAGFDNLGCDLMFALPGQDALTLERELDQLLGLAPEHLSCYGLTVEESTPFHHQHLRGALQLPEEDLFAELFLLVHRRLEAAGYGHYEISNYAKPGRQCRHNLNYWRRGSYLGLGAGAHSFCDRGWGERLEIPPDLERYAELLGRAADPSRILETFDRRGAMSESLYLGLRTAEGMDEEAFALRFGEPLSEVFSSALKKLSPHLLRSQGRLTLNLAGWLVYDHLIAEFL